MFGADRSREGEKRMSWQRVSGRIVVVAAAGIVLLAPTAANAKRKPPPPPPPPVTAAVAYQLDAAHSGAVADAIAARPTKRWSADLGAPVSYPLIAGGRVYVTTAARSLYALDATTGAKVWGPVVLGGTYPWSGLAYDNGQIFTVNSSGTLQAFDAASGTPIWALQLPGQFLFSSAPTATGGVVYTGGAGSGGTVYAVDEATHAVKWTAPVANGDQSSPAVSASGVYVSYACGVTYDLNPASGAQTWVRTTGCSGGGGTTPVLANGRLYVRDFSFPAVLDSANGNLLGGFAASGPAPAVDASSTYDLTGSTLVAAGVTTSAVRWSFSGDGQLSSAPLVAGGDVLIGSRSGTLYKLSSSTGAITWSASVGASIPAPDEQNVSQPLTGLATSGGLIVVPAGQLVVAYR
jgi:outer membrane protein assembly factor BamB